MGLGDLVFLASAALHDRSQRGAKVVEPRQTKMAFLTAALPLISWHTLESGVRK